MGNMLLWMSWFVSMEIYWNDYKAKYTQNNARNIWKIIGQKRDQIHNQQIHDN